MKLPQGVDASILAFLQARASFGPYNHRIAIRAHGPKIVIERIHAAFGGKVWQVGEGTTWRWTVAGEDLARYMDLMQEHVSKDVQRLFELGRRGLEAERVFRPSKTSAVTQEGFLNAMLGYPRKGPGRPPKDSKFRRELLSEPGGEEVPPVRMKWDCLVPEDEPWDEEEVLLMTVSEKGRVFKAADEGQAARWAEKARSTGQLHVEVAGLYVKVRLS
jgi:hypothetical protein